MSDIKKNDVMSAMIAFIKSTYKISLDHPNDQNLSNFNKIRSDSPNFVELSELIRCQICRDPSCNEYPCPSSNDIK